MSFIGAQPITELEIQCSTPHPTTPLVVEVQEQKGQFHMKILKNGGILNFTIFLGHLVHPVPVALLFEKYSAIVILKADII